MKAWAILIGIVVLSLSAAYFFLWQPSRPRPVLVPLQEKIISDLEAKNEKAEMEVKAAKAAQALAERKEREAAGRLAQRNREIAEWAAKYAELKSKPAQLVTNADEAREALKNMGWLK